MSKIHVTSTKETIGYRKSNLKHQENDEVQKMNDEKNLKDEENLKVI